MYEDVVAPGLDEVRVDVSDGEVVVQSAASGARTVYRVRVIGLASRDDAERVRSRVAALKQKKIDGERLKLWALDMGITQEQYSECLNSPDILGKIKGDIEQASQLQIQGTPAIFINGIPASNRSYQALRSQIQFRLGQ